jgi:hypothetical protein
VRACVGWAQPVAFSLTPRDAPIRVGENLPEPVWRSAAQAEVDRVMRHCAEGFSTRCRSGGKHLADPDRTPVLLYGRGLGEDECTSFLRALHPGLVTLADDGGFFVPGARSCSPNLHLIGREGDHTKLHTEVLIHLGAYAELVLDFGWPQSAIVFDPFFSGGALDLWGYTQETGGDVVLGVEAKARGTGPDGLDSLLRSFHKREADPSARIPHNHAAKWHEISGFTLQRPITVLLVADGVRWWFTAERHGPSLHFTPRGPLEWVAGS